MILLVIGGRELVAGAAAQGQVRDPAVRSPRNPSRVLPPAWQSLDTEKVFFRDAFRDALRGERPVHLLGNSNPAGMSTDDPAALPDPSPDKKRWSTIIAAETVEDEIKSLSQQVNQTVTTPAKFASGGYLDAQRQFSLLGMLFAIVHEFDGDIRWRNEAVSARDSFLQAALNTKDGSIQFYNAAKDYKMELAQLVRGGSMGGRRSTLPVKWTEMLDRRPLMERLETALQETIDPKLASAATMQADTVRLIHEAELMRAIAHVLTLDGLEESHDMDYVEYCEQLKQAASAVIQAVKQNNYESARSATGEINKSCNDCHESYR